MKSELLIQMDGGFYDRGRVVVIELSSYNMRRVYFIVYQRLFLLPGRSGVIDLI